jgi:hypothetical protein
VRSEDCAVRACFECGRKETWNLSGYPAETRRKCLDLTDVIYHLLQTRDDTAQHRLSKMFDELNELLKTKDERADHGMETIAIEQAEAKAAAMLGWIDEHDEEFTQMMHRPALITRRGFAA